MKVLAIDPGVHAGVAIAINGKLSDLITTDFWGAIDILEQNKDAHIVVELPATNHVWHDKAATKGAIQGTARRVGSVIREAELLIAYLVRNERRFGYVKPAGKVDSKLFNKITGWTGRTNQHCRDAGIMAISIKGLK